MQKIHEAQTEIEKLVQARKTRKALEQIQKLLKKNSKNESTLVQVCDWYRRLGLFHEGFRLLKRHGSIDSKRKTVSSSATARKILWAARFLNLMGASHFALQLIERLQGSDAALSSSATFSTGDFRVIGNIYLSNFGYARAYESFTKMRETQSGDLDYPSKLALVSFADSCAGMGRFEQAHLILDEVVQKTLPEENLLKGIALQARGEYRAKQGSYEKALGELAEAQKFYPEADETVDRGILFKWLGYVHGKLGHEKDSREYFEKALKMLKKGSIRAEAWLDVYRLRRELGEVSPDEKIKLAFYPGAHDEDSQIHEALFGSKAEASIQIDFSSDEYWIQGQATLGLTKELRLLAWVRMTQGWGIGLEAIKSLLWPDEVYAYDELEGRVHKLIKRIREVYQVPIRVRDHALDMDEKDASRISVHVTRKKERPSFLAQHQLPHFSGQEMGMYYALSKSQRSIYLALWIQNGWIRAEGKKPRLTYYRVPPAASINAAFSEHPRA